MTYYNFPSDIESISHCMIINAYRSGPNASENVDDSFRLYIPGGPPGGVLTWETALDYEDVKLSHIVGGTIAGIGSGIASMVGVAINPKVEVLFRNIELRKFQFNFLFAPVNEDESKEMKNIMRGLRAHASPEIILSDQTLNDPQKSYIGAANQWDYNKLNSGGAVTSPSEFTVNFYFKPNGSSWQENTNIPKIGRCVIERIDVDYANSNGTGEFSTFSNGHPVAAAMTVVFKEMRIIDRANVLRGY